MLGGKDPILLFLLYKKTPTASLQGLPVIGSTVSRLALPPVPIYLNEQQLGMFIAEEDKNVDIETSFETQSDGAPTIINQKGIGNVVTVKLQADKDSLGLTLLSAMIDLVFGKLTSSEYGITYLHGAITIFNGLLHNFSIVQNSDTTKVDITLEIARGASPAAASVEVSAVTGTSTLNSSTNVLQGGTLPGGGSFTSSGAAPTPIGGAP